MRTRSGPLLAELHAHTTWSDGAFSIGPVVDSHGSRGLDVLCSTDHVVRAHDPWLDPDEWRHRGIETAHVAGAAIITAHPFQDEEVVNRSQLTRTGIARPLLAA